jgi:hypothetical protein
MPQGTQVSLHALLDRVSLPLCHSLLGACAPVLLLLCHPQAVSIYDVTTLTVLITNTLRHHT